jgi:type II secretory pathway component PulF
MFGQADRAEAWQLVADMTHAGISDVDALEAAAKVNEGRGKKGAAKRLRTIKRAISSNRFAQAMQEQAAGAEAILFTSLGTSDVSQMFGSAARVMRIQQKINRAIREAIVGPTVLFLIIFLAIYIAGRRLFPVMIEIAPDGELDPLAQLIVSFGIWFGQNPFIIFTGLGVITLGIALMVPFYTGPLRDRLDNIPPFSLYRLAAGSAFVLTIVECAKGKEPITSKFITAMSLRVGRYTRWRLQKIARGFGEGNIGTACLKKGGGFPAIEINYVWDALDGQTDWEEPLGRFVDRWLEDIETTAKRNAALMRTVLMGFGALALGGVIYAIFALVLQAIQF